MDQRLKENSRKEQNKKEKDYENCEDKEKKMDEDLNKNCRQKWTIRKEIIKL